MSDQPAMSSGLSPPKAKRFCAGIECSICLEQMTDPRVLRCGHTFCFKCITDQSPIKCAICRHITEGNRAQLPPNFTVKRLVESDGEPRYACVKCNHQDDSLKVFWRCKSCGVQLICMKCVIAEHSQHDIETLEDLIEGRRKQLAQLKSDADGKTKEIRTICESARTMFTDVNESSKEILAIVQSCFKPTFNGGIDLLKARCDSILNVGDTCNSYILDSGRFQAIIDETPTTIADLKARANALSFKVVTLRNAVNNAKSAAYSLMEKMTADNDLKLPDSVLRQFARDTIRFESDGIDVLQLGEERYSHDQTIGFYVWRIMFKRTMTNGKDSMGLFVYRSVEPNSKEWSSGTQVRVRVISQQDGIRPLGFSYSHTFSCKKETYGSPDMMAWKDLIDPDKGYIKNGKIIIEADIRTLINFDPDITVKVATG